MLHGKIVERFERASNKEEASYEKCCPVCGSYQCEYIYINSRCRDAVGCDCCVDINVDDATGMMLYVLDGAVIGDETTIKTVDAYEN